MIIRSIELSNFRNFNKKKIDFCDSINVIFGLNGQGKTNLLEALSVACLGKSFRTRNDSDLIKIQQDRFQLIAQIHLDNGVEKLVNIQYGQDTAKNILINHAKIKSIVDLFGSFPVVILSPEDDSITNGPPSTRRRFINFVLSQLDKSYLKRLQDYDRIIKQRNKILQNAQESRYRFSEKIEPWNEEFFNCGKEITSKRKQYLQEIQKIVQPIHHELTSLLETFSLKYEPSFNLDWSFDDFCKYQENHINEEIMKGITTIGPHRDEVRFFIDKSDIRRFGSRGQHRSLLLALKIGVYKMIHEKLGETPVFLLDDVYSEIDAIREKAFNDYFMELKQVFITTHEKDIKFDLPDEFSKEIHYIYIENNTLENSQVDLSK